MTEAQKIVEYAISQIGTSEDPLGSNKQKYGALIDSTDWYLYKEGDRTWRHLVNGYDWCAQTVDASFITNFGIDKARKMLYRPVYNNYGAVVKYAFNYFKNAGQGFTKEEYNPQPGDVIYFQNSKGLSHTGIVVAVTASQVTTVEGNSGTNNWYVAKHTYSKTSSYIYGYGCPDYSTEPEPSKYTVGDTYNVLCDSLQIRKGPGTNYDSVGQLKREDKIVCKAISNDDSGNEWMQGEQGWSAAIYNGNTYIGNIGWVKRDDKWYYYDKNGELECDKWVKYKGSWYYMGADGAMVTGTQVIDGNRYYFYADGHVAQDEWIDGMFLGMSGVQDYPHMGKWKSDNKGEWYEDSSGWYPKNRCVRIDKVNYTFDANGYVKNKVSMSDYKVGNQYSVMTRNGLKVRTIASTKGIEITRLGYGTRFECRAITQDEDGNIWMRISAPVSGWVACVYNSEKYVG